MRVVQFIVAVYLGVLTEVCVDLFKCMARGFRMGDVHVIPRDIPLFAFSMGFFALLLISSLVATEKLVASEEKVTRGGRALLVSAFIVAVCISGAYFPSPCEKPVTTTPVR